MPLSSMDMATVTIPLLILLIIAHTCGVSQCLTCTSVNLRNKACEEGDVSASLPCLDPENSACMVSITKMADVGEMLTRGCCALEDKNYMGQLCRGGQVMESKYGSVREVNCKQDNCNAETMKDRARDKDEDKNLEVKKKADRQK